MPDIEKNDRRSYDQEIAELRAEVRMLSKNVEDLVDAWRTAKGMTSFVKWLAGIAGACIAIYGAIKGVT